MRVLVAPTAYKGTLSPVALTTAIASGARDALPDCQLVEAPIADGGDGTVEAVHHALGGTLEKMEVTGPVKQIVEAKWWHSDDLALVELASASGIAWLHRGNLDPMEAHTFGTGQVLLACLQKGFTNIVICVGGSASTDGGAGALTALGAKFHDRDGELVPLGGAYLGRITGCNLEALKIWESCRFQIATDVTNPLLGPNGASAIYGPQKGANNVQVTELDHNLSNFADVMENATGRIRRDAQGSGAAGGTAFGLSCGLDATIVGGFDWLSRLLGLEALVQASDIVLTGEGRLDAQTLYGKAVGQLAHICQRFDKPLYCVPAVAEGGDWKRFGFAGVLPTAHGRNPASSADVRRAVSRLLQR